MNWDTFFPAGTPILALPNWEHPRLFIAAWDLQTRWIGSSLYPASRWRARAFRFLLRFKASLGIGAIRVARKGWALEPFLSAAGREELVPWAVLLGTKGPTQKVIIELHNQDGEVSAYLKYGEALTAQSRISHEYAVLKALPRGFAPEPLYFGQLEDGVGLLVSAVHGRPIHAHASLPENIVRYVASLPASGFLAAEAHPWITQLFSHGEVKLEMWLTALESRKWAVLPQHGDFAPWNILQSSKREIFAIDWEYGAPEGFPGTDLAYYLLQVGALINRWSPERTRVHATNLLARLPWPGFNPKQAEAIVRLTAYDAYQKGMEDGHWENEPLQAWRRSVWEGI